MRIVGVVNITEDSFSDGGLYLESRAAIAHARRLHADGADVVEVGAASSHPDAASVTVDEERRRLIPVLDTLAGDGVVLSVDSTRPQIQRLALAHRVGYLNDVRGFPKPDMYPALADSDCRLIVMHSIEGGEIAVRRKTDPTAIWGRIEAFFAQRLDALDAAGIAQHRLVLDPGLGFFLGANPQPSLAVLGAIGRLRARFGIQVLVSPSRKSFLRAVTGRGVADIGPATLAAELYAARAGVDYIRTHDVRALTDALAVERAIQVRHEPAPIELVRDWYQQMNSGDLASASAKLHPDIEWIEAEHSPVAPGRPLIGVAEAAGAVWSGLARDWVDLRVVPEQFVPTSDGVAVIGRYVGRHTQSGAKIDAQALHLWTVVNGMITRYRGFADTYALHQAMKA
jgi:dihydropteroate synthase type 2